jgi:hypothetical protein
MTAKKALIVCDAIYLKIKFDKSKPNGQPRKDTDINIVKTLLPNFKPIKFKDGI